MTVAEYRRREGLPPRPCDLEAIAANAAALAKAAEQARRAQAEDELQRAIVNWLRYALRPDVRFCHVPNGGKRRRIEAARLKGLGVEAGWPDLSLAWSEPRSIALGFAGASSAVAKAMHAIAETPVSRSAFIELKFGDGKLTAKQLDFQRWCRENGIPHAVARSLDEVTDAVRSWGIVNPAALRDLDNPAAEAAKER